MTDLTTQELGALPSVGEAWGSEGTSSQDLLVPRIQLMHDISDLVKKRRAEPGTFVHSVTNELLAEKEKKFEFIPIMTYREWEINDVDDKGRNKYRNRIPMTPLNENLAYEDLDDSGKPIRRIRTLNFFSLVVSRLEEFPFLVSFKKSNLKAGKQLSTHFQMCGMKKVPPASHVFTLHSSEKTNDGYTFWVMNVEPARPSTAVEIATARKWYEVLKTAKVKVEEEATDEISEADLAPRF